MPIAWNDRAIIVAHGEPVLEGSLEEMIAAIGRLPAESWPGFAIRLPDRTNEPIGYDSDFMRALVLRLRDMHENASINFEVGPIGGSMSDTSGR